MRDLDVKAGFHPNLLPTWGGKASNIISQPKCWTSIKITKEYLEKYRSLANKQSKTFGGKRFQHANRDTRPRKFSILPRQTAALTPAESVLEKQANVFGNGNASARIIQKLNQFRNDENARRNLFERIKKKEREKHNSLKTRNLVIENKWLCDDKEKCMRYWSTINELKCKEGKNSVQSWPRPPTPNFSPADLARKTALRSLRRRQHFKKVILERQKRHNQREIYLNFLHNKKEFLAKQKAAEERREEARKGFQTLIMVAATTQVWRLEFERLRDKEREQNKMISCVTTLQRYWKKSKAEEYGRKYRNAVSAVRKFIVRSYAARKKRKQRENANIIYWALTLFENANFRKVVHTFRERVLNCQRYWRSYNDITNERLRALALKWDKVEREMMRTEIKRTIQAVKQKASEEQNVSDNRKTLGMSDKGSSNKVDKNSMKRKSNPSIDRQTSFRFQQRKGFKRKTSTVPKQSDAEKILARHRDSMNMTATLEAAADLGIHLHKRVPKSMKMELLKEYLHRKRQVFRQEWVNYKRERYNLQSQSQVVSIEDVRTLLIAPSFERAQEIWDKKFQERTEGEQSELSYFKLYLDTDLATMQRMIEKGRAAVEEQFLLELEVRESELDGDTFKQQSSTFLTNSIALGNNL